MLKRLLRQGFFSGNGILYLGIVLSIFLFALEGVVSSLFFGKGPITEQFVHTDPHDVLLHYLPALFLIIFSGLTQYFVKQYLQIESSLKDRENRLRVTTEQMPAILWTMDKNLVFTSMSGAALKNMNLKPGQLEGISLFDYLKTRDPNFLIIKVHQKALQGESIREDLAWQGRIYTTYLEPLRDSEGNVTGCIGIALDITEQRKTHADLEKSEDRFAGVLNAAADAIIATDSGGSITLFNSRATKMFGYSAKAIKGSDIGKLFPTQYREKYRLLMTGSSAEDQDSQGTGKRQEIYGLTKDGKEFPAEASISRLARDKELTFLIILHDISPRKEAEELIHHLAFSDPLTGLPNRTKLHEMLEEAIRDALIDGKLVAFLLIDLDRFKEVNDTLGHQRGDLLLQEVASRLKTVIRPTDQVARMGGDEFGLILPISRGMDATTVADKVKTVMETPYEIEGIPIAIDASIGIALAPDHGATADSLIQRADVAMYHAKDTTTGYTIYSTKLDRHSPRRLALLGELRNAIEEGQLCLHYQPLLLLPSLVVDSVEALVRWPHPVFGLIPPDQFIPPAERTGLINPLLEWVLKEALKQCSAWRTRGIEKNIAVNLSVRNLQNQKLPDMVQKLLESQGIPASFLKFEVTESAIMADPERGIEVLHKLDRLGVNLSIDDFGTGYSSLAVLKSLPVRELKIDISFIRSLNTDEGNTMIVRSTIELAHNLGMTVVAEGVEDQKTLEKLIDLGCDSIQGFHICKPLAGPELTVWLEEQSSTDKQPAHR